MQYIQCFNCRHGKICYTIGWEWCRDCAGTGFRVLNTEAILDRLDKMKLEGKLDATTIQCN